ncbi:O-acetylhomoserine aminocarboxypropyltransferase/cysteine synthase family protein [Halolamina salifodinae]|uniref:O-acetylhomoserine (Thiol)-lyase n=1 Tax=Halolamina salifodinae TaxID=1202767 RepID=A0A8T4GW31_9EURY|nr:aminotransferase class I/II-fold pyridoxal phosphate-dependent enzyme [Halolamina salifodinae]MBP1986660.1 O-acetylhomoserine (thiol)-lyase [Halolamina salifodinae]
MTRGFRSRSLHGGHEPEGNGPYAPPIHQTTSYRFESADAAADRYALAEDGDIYSRLSNPTVRVLEERLASLSGGVGAVATNAGMAAIDVLTTVLARAGKNIVTAGDLYGGTTAYFAHTASQRGIEIRTVDTLDYEAYADAIDEDTAYVHVETVANPSLVTPDFERLADIAHEHATPLVVDNTFASPALCRPLEHGADVVWESTTKWIHGSGTTVGGVVVDGGTFPWDHPDADYPELSGENPAFGIDFSEQFGEEALTYALRQRGVRPLGGQQTPFDAWATLQGLETLDLRMDRHSENAGIVADHLADHPDVAWVTYPGHEDHPTHENAQRYLDGFAGMIAFGLEEGFSAGKQFCEAVELAGFVANVGDARTLVIHPASTTHAQLSEEEQRAAGVSPDLLRFSVGLEEPEDIIDDIDAAIERATA